MNNAPIAEAYSAFAYPSMTIPDMHPNTLAVMARMFGLAAADPQRCRVLELGCSSGGSTIPFSYSLPESTFLGVDLVPASIAEARATAEQLGLRNVEFRCADILALGDELGTFDYVISHGVYSWVPAEVRDKMMQICRRHLAANGVAYISYNARPGSDLRQMLRDIMMFHTAGAQTSAERVYQGRAVTEFLASAQEGIEIYNRVMQWNRERIGKLHDALFFHDDLGTVNQPCYFFEFIRHAAAHQLRYLGEPELLSMSDRRFAPAIREQLRRLSSDLLAAEQYMDFLSGRSFRETLLCHAEVELDRHLKPARMKEFLFATMLEPVSARPSVSSEEPEEFRIAPDRSTKTAHPAAKAILTALAGVYPRCLSFEELHAGVNVHLPEITADQLAEALLEVCASTAALELSVMHPPCVASVSERPRASAVARLQASRGIPVVANLRGHRVGAEDKLLLRLLALADGTRDHAALAETLTAEVEAGRLPRPAEAEKSTQPLSEIMAQGVERNLKAACRYSLLEM
jgi:methyltransferase-like protein/2-polyprenyl-3-methyl-5-hydroxy-6-metoxy-1,4-benzoquinol methylase